MTKSVLKSQLDDLVGKVVVFGKLAEHLESYPEEGMRALVRSVEFDANPDAHDAAHLVEVDYGPFEQHNSSFETASYTGRDGESLLTVHQIGLYQSSEILHLPAHFPGSPFRADDELTRQYFETVRPDGLDLANTPEPR